MAITSTTDNALPTAGTTYQRRKEPHVSRLWLLAFIVLSALLTSGALVLRYRLEGVEGAVAALAQARTGATLNFENAQVAGVRSIRLEGIEVAYPSPEGPENRAEIGSMYVQFAILDLLRGQFTLESLQFQDAHITINRSAMPMATRSQSRSTRGDRSSPLQLGALNIEGSNCRLTVNNTTRGTAIDLDQVDFSIRKPAASSSLNGEVSALRDGLSENTVAVSGFFESTDRFAIRARLANITADELNPYLPAQRRFVESGKLNIEARVEALPDAPISLWVSSDIEELGVRNQPDLLPDYSGNLSATMEYDPKIQKLANISARAVSDDWRGTVYGDVDFAAASPAFNLDIDVAPIPLSTLLEAFLLDRLEPFGELTFVPNPSSSLQVRVAGTTSEPDITARLRLPGAEAQFTSANPRWPSGAIVFGPLEAAWDSETGTPKAHATILRGHVHQEEFDIRVEDLAGIVDIDGTKISSETFSGTLTGQSFVGSIDFDIPTRTGEFALSGGVSNLEDTPIHDRIKHTVLWGSGSVRATGTLTPDEYTAQIFADATQCRVLYNWWLDKPAGLAAAGTVNLKFRPNESLSLDIDANVAASPVEAQFRVARVGSKWRLLTFKATSEKGDVSQVSRAVRFPYEISGGHGTDIIYEWERKFEGPDEWVANASGAFDRIRFRPDGGEHDFVLEDGTFEVFTTKGENNRGVITLEVARGQTPPIRGSTWFIDPRQDDPLLEEYPRVPRDWTYNLRAAAANVPPWDGTNFVGEGYFNRPESGLRFFNANVGDGRVQGMFQYHSVEHLSQLNAEWNKIPSKYLIDYLKLPNVLAGINTGSIDYRVDNDDPSTSQGNGTFTVSDGRFSADYLITVLEGSDGFGASLLPRSLAFKTLSTEVQVRGDQITTSNLFLDSEGFKLTGEGGFVLDGDMDYDVKVAISPQTAEEIPPLRDALNLEGMKIAGQDIELGFNVKGPLFKPRGELASLPTADVMLVSGALGVGTDLIDLPRQILVDVFKVFAGTAMAN